MDIKKAIEWQKAFKKTYKGIPKEVDEACDTAMSALEKQIPKEIDFEMNFGDCESRFSCSCGKKILVRHDRGVMNNHNAPNYCPNCGQALDWGDAN